jgi:outer membrane lipoprotein SlyB
MLQFRSIPFVALAVLAGCQADYSPDTYATRAVQQANRAEQGLLVGRRDVNITAEGSTGAATGAAAGGVIGAQSPGGGIVAALGGVGGALVGGLIGTTVEHAAGDSTAFEYIVRTSRDELIAVTQRDATPLVVGQRVLVITGTQARVVPDYTVEPPATPADAAAVLEDGLAAAATSAPPPAEARQPDDRPPESLAPASAPPALPAAPVTVAPPPTVEDAPPPPPQSAPRAALPPVAGAATP